MHNEIKIDNRRCDICLRLLEKNNNTLSKITCDPCIMIAREQHAAAIKLAADRKLKYQENEKKRLASLKPIQELAARLSNQLECKERLNGDKFICIKDNAQDKELLTGIILQAHENKLPDNYIYEWASEALEAIASYHDPEDYISDIQPEVYTHELMKWLASHYDRKELVNQTIQELGFTDMDNALMAAQTMEKEAVYQSIFQSLTEIIDNQDEIVA
jgi:hypothetical protein